MRTSLSIVVLGPLLGMGMFSMQGCGGAGAGVSDGTGYEDPTEGHAPDVVPSGWSESQGGQPNPGGSCPEDPNATPMLLPQTGVEYCVKAHPDCSTAGTNCPLYVTINTDGAYFSRVDDPTQNGKFITVELYTETDGDAIKDKLAELPRVIAADYPGLDKARVYAVGWSAGVGALTRGLCHKSKKSDFSELGTTSDIYAALVGLGGCSCTNDYVQLAGNWHILTWNGMEDPFNGGDSCESGLRERAAVNGCADPGAATWVAVQPDDALAKNADGSTNAELIRFEGCAYGEVMGYRFRDEGHVLSAKQHFDPKISGYDTAWNFLQGKTKS